MKRLILLLALLFSGCALHGTPNNPWEKPTRFIVLTIRDDSSAVIPTATGKLTPVGQPTTDCATSSVERLTCFTTIAKGAAQLIVSADGFESKTVTIDSLAIPEQGELVLGRTLRPLPRLVGEGPHFRLENGERITLIGNNEHQLLEKWINHRADYEAVLAQRMNLDGAGLRFNTLRVASMCNERFPDGHLETCRLTFDEAYYRALRAMADDLNRKGFYLKLTVFWGELMPDPDQQLRHWHAIDDALCGTTNVIVDLGNELDNSFKSLDPSRFEKMQCVLSGRGSYTQHGPIPFRPEWDFEDIHLNGAFEWQRKPHNAMELSRGTGGIPASRKPAGVDEINRIPEQDGNLAHVEDAGKVGAELTYGLFFHSDHGRFSELFNDGELEGARAMVRGMQSVPLDCQEQGNYKLRNDLLTPELLRVYQTLDEDRCLVPVRK